MKIFKFLCQKPFKISNHFKSPLKPSGPGFDSLYLLPLRSIYRDNLEEDKMEKWKRFALAAPCLKLYAD